MPRKHKRRKPVASPENVWIAPRPPNQSEPRTFEPAGAARSNRYLEFADIAMGARQAPQHKKKNRGTAHVQHQNVEGKVTPINRPRAPGSGLSAIPADLAENFAGPIFPVWLLTLLLQKQVYPSMKN